MPLQRFERTIVKVLLRVKPSVSIRYKLIVQIKISSTFYILLHLKKILTTFAFFKNLQSNSSLRVRPSILIGFLWCITALCVSAQNPFEITSRLSVKEAVGTDRATPIADDTTVTIATTPSIDTPLNVLTEASDNPFELIAREENNAAPIEGETTDEQIDETTLPTIDTASVRDFISSAQTEINSSTAFLLLLLILIPLTVLFTIFRNYFGKAYDSVKGESTLNRSYRDYAGTSVVQMNSWFGIYLLNIGIFAALLLNHYGILLGTPIWVHIIICISAMISFILFKRLVLFFLAYLFSFQKEVYLYTYLLLVFGIITGVFLALFNVAILYAPDVLSNAVIYIALAVFIALHLIRTYRALLIINRLIVLHTFHFLLYICAVELAPIFILTKLVMLYDQ